MRKPVQTPSAPKAIGPYSQAIEAGGFVFCSGQIGLDPRTGVLVEGGLDAECHQVMQNLGAVLGWCGLGFGDVVRSTIYLVDLGDFSRVNEIYGSYLEEPWPARVAVGVAALPKGARVEIEMVAQLRAETGH